MLDSICCQKCERNRVSLQVAIPQVMVPGGCNSMHPSGLHIVCSCTESQFVQHTQVHQVGCSLHHVCVEIFLAVVTNLAWRMHSGRIASKSAMQTCGCQQK